MIVQQQIGKGTVFSVNYLGALGKELTNFLDFNLAPPTNVTITIKDTTGKGPLPNGAQYFYQPQIPREQWLLEVRAVLSPVVSRKLRDPFPRHRSAQQSGSHWGIDNDADMMAQGEGKR